MRVSIFLDTPLIKIKFLSNSFRHHHFHHLIIYLPFYTLSLPFLLSFDPLITFLHASHSLPDFSRQPPRQNATPTNLHDLLPTGAAQRNPPAPPPTGPNKLCLCQQSEIESSRRNSGTMFASLLPASNATAGIDSDSDSDGKWRYPENYHERALLLRQSIVGFRSIAQGR